MNIPGDFSAPPGVPGKTRLAGKNIREEKGALWDGLKKTTEGRTLRWNNFINGKRPDRSIPRIF
jgi:hypothetical protein